MGDTATMDAGRELRLHEAAARADRSEKTVRRWVALGRVKGRRVLGRVLIDPTSLAAMLAGEPIGATAGAK